MADKKTRVDNIHDQMPAVFNTRSNINWKAIIEAIGNEDQETLDLIESVRQQFFVKTASRPYLDRLGTANLVQRPRFVGMDDPTFRDFIPVMSYQPKQVKLIMDKLLDIFFFEESTTSFLSSGLSAPFNLADKWELEYFVDSFADERIEFRAEEFTDINNATADEVVAAINRQATNSYAIAFEDSITKLVNIRLFTKTVGSKGAVEITGGRADIGLQFDGFNTLAGQGIGTEWTVDLVGDTVTMTYTGTGGSPNIDRLQVGDVVIITRAGNEGSFELIEVDPSNDIIKFVNLFATPETFTENSTDIVKFITPFEANVYLRDRRAVVWQVKPGEIIVEMPPSPPVVKRSRKGSAHINGIESLVTDTPTLNSLELANADKFPDDGGRFFFVPLNEIQTYHPEDMSTDIFQYKSKLSSCLPVYTYVSKTGDVLEGISPALPTTANTVPLSLVSANRDANNTITVTTTTPHDYKVGDYVILEDAQSLTSAYSTDFDGTDDHILCGNDSSIQFDGLADAFSTSSWVYVDNISDMNAILSTRTLTTGTTGWEVTRSFTDDISLIMQGTGTPGGDALTLRTLDSPVVAGSWMHIVTTYDGSGNAGGMAIYVNGVARAAGIAVNNLSTSSVASNQLSIGARVTGQNATDGMIDEVSIYNAELTPAQVTELYNAGVPTDPDQSTASGDLVSWWKMGDGDTYPTITDQVGNNDGTMTNMDAGDIVSISPEIVTVYSNVNGAWKITSINSDTELELYSFMGPFGAISSTGGTVRIERIGTSSAGSRVILTSAQIEEGLEGPFLWDENSDFVLSSLTTNLVSEIEAGTTQRNIQVDPNEIPNEAGRLIFDFGTEKQEGPVRYFFKPSATSLALDPSYVFNYTHDVGSSVAMIRRRGGIQFGGLGAEYAGYITDPAAAREVLQELMEEVKSVGIFINFIVRYPEQFYATIDNYRSGVDPG